MRVFLDTNVLLDVLLARQPSYAASAAAWTSVESGRHIGGISAISFNNAYYLIRRSKGDAEARKAIATMRGFFEVVPLDASILDGAIGSPLKDFEDAIQWFSAQRMAADFLITRNDGDFPQGIPEVMTPTMFLAIGSASP
jgi:predicted nucleic acid-binding protein